MRESGDDCSAVQVVAAMAAAPDDFTVQSNGCEAASYQLSPDGLAASSWAAEFTKAGGIERVQAAMLLGTGHRNDNLLLLCGRALGRLHISVPDIYCDCRRDCTNGGCSAQQVLGSMGAHMNSFDAQHGGLHALLYRSRTIGLTSDPDGIVQRVTAAMSAFPNDEVCPREGHTLDEWQACRTRKFGMKEIQHYGCEVLVRELAASAEETQRRRKQQILEAGVGGLATAAISADWANLEAYADWSDRDAVYAASWLDSCPRLLQVLGLPAPPMSDGACATFLSVSGSIEPPHATCGDSVDAEGADTYLPLCSATQVVLALNADPTDSVSRDVIAYNACYLLAETMQHDATAASAIEAAGGAQAITATMFAMPWDDRIQTTCTSTLRTLQDSLAANNAHRRSMFVL